MDPFDHLEAHGAFIGNWQMTCQTPPQKSLLWRQARLFHLNCLFGRPASKSFAPLKDRVTVAAGIRLSTWKV